MIDELNELSSSPFGSTLVGTIGLVYYEAACSELSTVEGLGVSFAQASRSVSTGRCVVVVIIVAVVVVDVIAVV